MTRPGKALRDKAFADALENADTIRERELDNAFAAQAIRDREIAFPTLTADNADLAIRFQNERLETYRANSVEYAAVVSRIRQRVATLKGRR